VAERVKGESEVMTMKRIGSWVGALLALAGMPASAGIVPETGTYWNPARDGEGAFVEVQGEMASITLFTYNLDGTANFYFAAGRLTQMPQNEQAIEGLYPMTALQADLFRTHHGPIFNTPDSGARPTEATKVGRVIVRFSRVRGFELQTFLDSPVPDGSWAVRTSLWSRFNYGFGQIGRSVTMSYRSFCWTDLRGDWLFIDLTDPARPPWRFHFSTLEVTPPADALICQQPRELPPQILIYRDPERGATLRCIHASREQPDPEDFQGRVKCELRLDGTPEPLLWFSPEDVGLKRISASLGGDPGDLVLRSEARVVGYRVE
jgi:hypothetical protein